MTKWFSKHSRFFEGWYTEAPKSTYTERIRRLHDLYPDATLNQLRGHPRDDEIPLARAKSPEIWKRDWSTLSGHEKEQREKSLKVISRMRKNGFSLTKASSEVGVSPNTVIRCTNALRKDGNAWKVKKYDHISRMMKMNEDGNEILVHIKDSRHASTVGRYQNAVKNFLLTGDAFVLEPFEGKRIKDAEGNWYVLDTDGEHSMRSARQERMRSSMTSMGKETPVRYGRYPLSTDDRIEESKRIEEIIAKGSYCFVCGYSYDSMIIEMHHIGGKKNSKTMIPVCPNCHKVLTMKQRSWPTEWTRLDNPPEVRLALIMRGWSETNSLMMKNVSDLMGQRPW